METAAALGEIGDNRAVEPLISHLKDSDSYVRYETAQALGMIGDMRALQPLDELGNNENGFVREVEVEALEHIERKNLPIDKEKFSWPLKLLSLGG
jgi:HEAT repeat protein